MTAEAGDDVEVDVKSDEALLAAVCREAQSLLGRVGGSVTRLTVRAGEHRVDIEWDPTTAPPAAVAAGGTVTTAADAVLDEPDGRVTITAPLVGTLYRSGEPGAKPFVEEGDVIERGDVVALIEAMKLFNPIESDHAGRVAKILVSDGEMVEFGQDLMVIEPADGPDASADGAGD